MLLKVKNISLRSEDVSWFEIKSGDHLYPTVLNIGMKDGTLHKIEHGYGYDTTDVYTIERELTNAIANESRTLNEG